MLTNNYYAIVRAFLGGCSDTSTGCMVVDTSGTSHSVYTKFGNTNQGIASLYADFYAGFSDATAKKGFFFGDGTAEPTKNDFYLSGNRITTFTIASKSVSCSTVGDTTTSTITFTLTNTGESDITVSEIAHVADVYRGSSGAMQVMMDRVLLDSPVTIAPGAQGTVVYRRSVTMPS